MVLWYMEQQTISTFEFWAFTVTAKTLAGMKFYQKIVHLQIFCPSVKNKRYFKQQQNRNSG